MLDVNHEPVAESAPRAERNYWSRGSKKLSMLPFILWLLDEG